MKEFLKLKRCIYFKYILVLFTLFIANSCTAQNKKEMEKEIINIYTEEANLMINYPNYPLYSLVVNKMKCRVVVRVNGLPHWIELTANHGESMALYLNSYLPKSGIQTLTVEIYPNEGVEYIPDGAVADFRLTYAPDRHKTEITDYEVLVEKSLPEDIGEMKLPYFEITIPFEATLPYDFSQELELAQNLEDIPDIEKLVVAKYNQLKKLMESGKGVEFVKEFKYQRFRSSNYLYATKTELLSTINFNDNNSLILFCLSNGDIEYRKIPEFKDYEMVFGFGGKVVMLRSIKNKKTLFNVYVGGEYSNPFWNTIYLFMPEGADELKVW